MEDEYGRRWQAKSRPYEGIPALLDELQERTIPMVVLSNKPESFTVQAVAHLLTDWHFAIVRGARPNVPTKPDPTSALEMADEIHIAPRDFIYMAIPTRICKRLARQACMHWGPPGVFAREQNCWIAAPSTC